MGNLIAQGLYDPERDTFTGAAHGGVVGFTVGDIFSTLGSMLTGSGRRGRRAAGIEEGRPPEEESILGETPGTEQIPEIPAGPAQRPAGPEMPPGGTQKPPPGPETPPALPGAGPAPSLFIRLDIGQPSGTPIPPARSAVPGAPYEGPSAREIDDEATKTKPEPTPGEAGADNFPQGHFKWNGLDLSIETAKGGVRRDTKPGAPQPWAVEDFPAHYGKIKGTKGAAGVHLDFYLGDHARGRRPRRRRGVEAYPPRR